MEFAFRRVRPPVLTFFCLILGSQAILAQNQNNDDENFDCTLTGQECLNNGVCNTQTLLCDCPLADNNDDQSYLYYGDNCQFENPCYAIHPVIGDHNSTLDTSACKHSGLCTAYLDGSNAFTCECLPGFTGSTCQNIDVCYNVNCQNGGWCEANRGCWCQDGYYGPSCENKDLCYAVNCGEFGICQEDTGKCLCNNGYSGDYCETFNPCWETSCLNGGSCDEISGLCTCVAGFHGPRCENNDSCKTMTGPVLCNDNGYCDNSDNEFYVCICKPGFYGKDCEHKDLCFNVNCNDGRCRHGTCICNDGFSGEFCEETIADNDPCEPSPCEFGSSCSVVQLPTYEHTNSNSTTKERRNSYHCECLPGTWGQNCQVITDSGISDVCSRFLPCGDSGICHNDENTGSFTCDCYKGYEGTFCERTILHPCSVDPCGKNGACHESADGYNFRCVCDENWSGPNCNVFRMPKTVENNSGIPTCPSGSFQEKEETTLEISLKYINNLGKILEEELSRENSLCFKLLTDRFFGALTFSEALLADGQAISKITNQPEKSLFIDRIINTFKDSFTDCEDSSCISKYFCENAFSSSQLFLQISETTSKNLVYICENEAWRLEEYIVAGDITGLEKACAFDFVPIPYVREEKEICQESNN